jgi:DNA-binding IclR family transcriptional regulator
MSSTSADKLPPDEREPSAADDNTLDSVAVVAEILDELAAARQPLGVTQLARQLDHSKARMHRYLVSLKRLGLVEQDAASERYRLGWKLFQLGEAAGQQFDLRRLADPYLRRLRDLTGLTALLSVPVNGEALVIAAVESERNVCITVKPGNRPAAHCSAQGRIVLAFADEATQSRQLRRALAALTPQSVAAPAAVRRRLADIRERLYEDAPNEVLTGINTLAAPILRKGDELVGQIGIVGSIQDIPSPALAQQIDLVRGCAAALSEMLEGALYRTRGIDVPRDLRPLSPVRASPISTKEDS